MRFGLVGTGYWARITHAQAIASTPGAELAAVWGRNRQAAQALGADPFDQGFAAGVRLSRQQVIAAVRDPRSTSTAPS